MQVKKKLNIGEAYIYINYIRQCLVFGSIKCNNKQPCRLQGLQKYIQIIKYKAQATSTSINFRNCTYYLINKIKILISLGDILQRNFKYKKKKKEKSHYKRREDLV